jgi:hypothetical protein
MDAHEKPTVFHDPAQKVRVAFLNPALHGEAQIELVEPAAADSPVLRFLETCGGGLHHLCYEVENLDEHMRAMRAAGCRTVRPPVAAIAFGGRRIGWMLAPHNLLLEFLEAPNLSDG